MMVLEASFDVWRIPVYQGRRWAGVMLMMRPSGRPHLHRQAAGGRILDTTYFGLVQPWRDA